MKKVAYVLWIGGTVVLGVHAHGEFGLVFAANMALIIGGVFYGAAVGLAAAQTQEGKP